MLQSGWKPARHHQAGLSDVHYIIASYLLAVTANLLNCVAGMLPFPPGVTKTKVALTLCTLMCWELALPFKSNRRCWQMAWMNHIRKPPEKKAFLATLTIKEMDEKKSSSRLIISLHAAQAGFPWCNEGLRGSCILIYFSLEIVCLLQSQPQGLLERTSENICSPLQSAWMGMVPFHSMSRPQQPEVIADHLTLILFGISFSLLIITPEQKTEIDLKSPIAFWVPLWAYRWCKGISLEGGRLHPFYFGEEN